MSEVTANIAEETLTADVVTEQININLEEEVFEAFIVEEQINVEINEEVININFGDVVAIIERELEQGVPFIDTDYLYVVFSADVKRTDRDTWVVDYATFITTPTTLAEVQALF